MQNAPKRSALVLALIMIFLSFGQKVAAQEQKTDRLVEQFDSSPSLLSARAFLQELHRQGFIEQPIHFTATTPIDTLRQQVWYWAAEYFYDRQDYGRAASYGQKALPLCQVGGNRQVEGDCLNILALTYVRKGEFEQAARYAKLCNQLDLKQGDADNIASSFNTLAGIYMSLRQPKEAEKYILKAIGYCQKADNPVRMAVLQGMASEVYHHLGDDETALDYATKAWQTEQQLGRPDKVAIRQAQRAAALIALKRTAEAQQALQEAIPGLRKSGNLHSLGIACNQMGLLLLHEKNDTAAVRYYNEALAIFTSQHDIYNESHTRRGLYEALRNSNPSLAMLHNDRYNDLRDSLYDRETGQLLSKYAAEYGYEELQQQNADDRSAYRLYLIILVVLIAVILAAWFCYRRCQQRRIRLLMQELAKYEDSRYDDSRCDDSRCEGNSRGYEGNSRGYEGTGVRGCENQRSAPTGKANSLVEGEEGNLAPSHPRTPAPSNTTPAPSSIPAPTTDTPDDPLTTEEREFLMRVIEVVNLRLATREFSIDAVATEMGMSRSTFYRRLQDASGFTPKAYIMAIQMRRAENLLKRYPDMLVTEVSEQCGFEDVSSFNRAFKRASGVSPSQYRENNLPPGH